MRDSPQMLEDVKNFMIRREESRLTARMTVTDPGSCPTVIVMALFVVALHLPIFEMGARLQ